MAFSLSSIFSHQPASVPATAGVPQGQNQGHPTASTPTAPAATTPTTTPPTPTPEPESKPASPLDQYASLWQTATTADGKPVAPVSDPLTQPLFNFDPAKITESANQMDFTGGINPETITKALNGDTAAFTEALNQGIRAAVVGLTLSNGQLLNNALVSNNQRITQQLPTHIKQQKLLEPSPEDNPVFSHPAAQPLVQSLKKMALAKNPSADVNDINKQIAGFLSGFATAVTEAAAPAGPAKGSITTGAAMQKETDWSTFL